ncbi:putative efflux pump membrane fusion protein [Sporotomaculum syntrophicum]|uniref:Efflux pump membrane fusion protein n=1 Tax=Sporotomaculum syntrophicum TaxID=182264 RepID=A0A9D3AXN7_9FIRM|nr:HlyD family efflux transporter periplasmic adaptor subunit [Sporotomaculum syntrophicum]KAF1083909.1 putative efflux pump membrane fusion protein [Sporotomaculum syntrophicum]
MVILKKAVAVLVILLLAAGAYRAYIHYYQPEAELIQATGTIEATTVELNAKTAGIIARLAADTGDSVTAGQLVAELSRSDLVAQRERDALGVLKAEAQLADLQSGAREQEKNEAATGVSLAQVNLEKATTDLARMEYLFQNGAAPQAEYDQAKTNAELAKNQLAAAEARLKVVEAGSRPEQIKAARAEVERSRAVLKASDALLADLKVYAPIAGVVLSRNYEVGEYVQMGASLATVADLMDLWIKVYIPTDDLPQIKLGQQVQFSVSGMEQQYKGVVEEIATRGEFTPKTIQTQQERANVVFAVKIKIGDTGGVLKPGMPADVTFGPRQTGD